MQPVEGASSSGTVIPAKAGIQSRRIYAASLDSGLRRNDGVLANVSTDWVKTGGHRHFSPLLGNPAQHHPIATLLF